MIQKITKQKFGLGACVVFACTLGLSSCEEVKKEQEKQEQARKETLSALDQKNQELKEAQRMLEEGPAPKKIEPPVGSFKKPLGNEIKVQKK